MLRGLPPARPARAPWATRSDAFSMRLLIVRLGAVGDIIHTLPVAAALRRKFPDATVDWAVDERYAELLELTPVIDRPIVLASRSRPAVAAWLAFRRELRDGGYDVALDLQGLAKSAAAVWLSGATRRVGFAAPFLRERWAGWGYDETIHPGNPRHVIDRNLGILAAVGESEPSAVAWSFPLEAPPSPLVDELRGDLDAPTGRYAVLNPNAAWPTKRWPPERFAAIATHLRDAHGLPAVVVWGPGDGESSAVAAVDASDGAATLAPESSLAELAALLQGAALVVSGDTGPLHLAAALGVPVVGLYGPSDPARNGPWAEADVVVAAECDCYRQRARSGPEGRMARHCTAPSWCLDRLEVAQVCAAIDRRLGRAAPRADA
ncbi:MAG: lipopolysaccharide heptosyltransferase I [Acidobacteria bacterium]|nr:lipopolysaccharide heptosyltransferase I [Acidobacteriota bacterium]